MNIIILNKTNLSLTAITVDVSSGITNHYYIVQRSEYLEVVVEQLTGYDGYINDDDERTLIQRSINKNINLNDALDYLVNNL